MRNCRHLVVLLLLLAGWSCTRTADVDLPPHKPSLVVHGYVPLGDTIAITVGRTVGLEQPVPDVLTYVTGALAILTVDGGQADTMRYDAARKRYVSRHVATTGRIYELRVSADSFRSVVARTRAPQPIPSAALTRVANARVTTTGTRLDDVTFRFSDPAGEKNHYLVAIYAAPRYPDMPFLCAYTHEPVVERFQGDFLPYDPASCFGEELLFTDRSFNGQTKALAISAHSEQLRTEMGVDGRVLRPYLKRYSINEEYYRYFKTTVTLGYNSGPSFVDPVTIRGNVTNGYGLFTVYSAAVDTIP